MQEIPGGEYAVVTHKGPFERLPDVYAQLYGDWLPHSGREPAEVIKQLTRASISRRAVSAVVRFHNPIVP